MESSRKLRTLKLSTLAISSVVFVEVALGLTVGSLAIISDGLHAFLDTLTTLMLFLTTRISLRPADEEHMYGHEKFEPIGGLVGGVVLIGVAILIFYEAVVRIIGNAGINFGLEYAGFIAIGFTFCIDFFRVGIFRRSRSSESSTMKAGFYHAIADLSSTVIAFVGFGLATLNIRYGDALASMILSVLLSYMSVRLVWASSLELSDVVSVDIVEKVKKIIINTQGISKYKGLRIRKAGAKWFVEASVQVPDYVSLDKAHDLASRLEEDIRTGLGNAEVIIHVEPPEKGLSTEQLVEKIALTVEGVKEVHEITTAYLEGKLYLTLHAHVDPKLSVEQTHEIAEHIEHEIMGSIKDVENVAVHVEPSSAKHQKGSSATEKEIDAVIHKTAESYKGSIRIKRIVTYVAANQRYINLDCCFTKQVTIEEAHKIASEIEEKLMESFAETEVTVHIEPEDVCSQAENEGSSI